MARCWKVVSTLLSYRIEEEVFLVGSFLGVVVARVRLVTVLVKVASHQLALKWKDLCMVRCSTLASKLTYCRTGSLAGRIDLHHFYLEASANSAVLSALGAVCSVRAVTELSVV